MKPSTKGYSPEQVGAGTLDNGKSVVILYIKEFKEQLERVAKADQMQYYYTWSYKEDNDSHLLFIYWLNDEEITVVFPPAQHSVVESLRTPKDLIITATPINKLVEKAHRSGQDFFDMEEAVIIRDAVYKEPGGLNH